MLPEPHGCGLGRAPAITVAYAIATAGKHLFKRVLRSDPVPRKIVTDRLRSYPAAKADIPEPLNAKHVFVKAAADVYNRAENSHQPTRERERRMRGFRDPERTQTFLSSFGPIPQHFALKRRLLRASLIANTSRPGLSRGTNLPTSSKLRRLAFEPQCVMARRRPSQPKLTAPIGKPPQARIVGDLGPSITFNRS